MGQTLLRPFRYFFTLILITLACFLGAPFGPAAAADDADISFGVPPWPGEYVKAAAARQILDALGYTTKQFEGAGPFLMNSVGEGEPNAYMAVWRPVNNGVIEPLLESGNVVLLNTNVDNAKYNIVVPQYVWDAGVHSIADLNRFADRFEHKIYGIEVGNVGNELVIDAIDNDTYDLSGWELVASSTAGMLTQADRRISKNEWVAFLGWKPHWMNVEFDLKYLNDPLNLWGPNGGQNAIQTVVNKKFADSHPNITLFLKQMDVGSKVQSEWIYDYAYKNQPADDVARKWIEVHPDTVAKWLTGVTSSDGVTDAFKAIQDDFDFSPAKS